MCNSQLARIMNNVDVGRIFWMVSGPLDLHTQLYNDHILWRYLSPKSRNTDIRKFATSSTRSHLYLQEARNPE
jgi:hypothetical protein